MAGTSPAMTSVDQAHDVGLLHDQEILAVDLALGARPLAEQHAITGLHLDRDKLAGFVTAAGADGDDFPFRRLFLGGVGYDDAALGLFFGVDALDDHAIMQRPELGFCHIHPHRRAWRPWRLEKWFYYSALALIINECQPAPAEIGRQRDRVKTSTSLRCSHRIRKKLFSMVKPG